MRAPMSAVIAEIADPCEAAALSKLKLLTAPEIARFCERWLAEDMDHGSAEIAWIAAEPGLVMSDVEPVFAKVLTQLGGEPPATDDAARTAVRLYARAIADGCVPAREGMDAMVADLSLQFDDDVKPLIEGPDRDPRDGQMYAGQMLGIEGLYTWHRELIDADSGSMLFYFNELPRKAQLARFRDELRSAARRLAEHLEAAGAATPGAGVGPAAG